MPALTQEKYDKNGFKLLKKEHIKELIYHNSKLKNPKHNAIEYKHKSGAKILLLQNDDPEMSFCIGFKTLPKDNTGVFHILEHSVLCGSKKFPVKEPFTNLLKSSMQTFLNAMTFPDKTIYPVASTNQKDLFNLIDVYMDAVLFPNIYKNKNIFYQEGGHKTAVKNKNIWYEDFNGVVYNEMKGVYSEPTEHLMENLLKGLFPNSCYAYSYGGSPESIKKLSYQEYLAQHKHNYKLSNCYIIIYGNVDKNKIFSHLNSKYLSKTKEINKWQDVKQSKKTTLGKFPNKANSKSSLKRIEIPTSKENTCCGIAYACKKDRNKTIASKILIDAIASSNESPLKRYLLSQNLASDISFEVVNDFKYPFILVQAKNIKKDSCKKLYKCINEKITDIIKNGINKNILEASISNFEYNIKEKDPDCSTGIDLSIEVMSEWLYDKKKSTLAIYNVDTLKWLKKIAKSDYFEKLAKEIFITNKWISQSEILTSSKKEKNKLKKISSQNVKSIVKNCENIKAWQDKADDPQDEAKIPTMSKSDIGKINNYPKWIKEKSKVPMIRYELNTNGIVYVNRYYSLNNLNKNELPYVNILCNILGKLDTDKYKSNEIDLIWQGKIGSMSFSPCYFENSKDPKKIELKLNISASCLKENVIYLLDFIDDIIFNTNYNNSSKIKTILLQLKSNIEQNLLAMGHLSSINRALSNMLPAYKAKDLISGIDFYNFLKALLKDFDKQLPNLQKNLRSISKKIFFSKPTISFMGDKKTYKKYVKNLNTDYYKKSCKDKNWNFKLNKQNEAFLIPSNVNYCALVNDSRLFLKNKIKKLDVASKIIALEYLWDHVRVKNGAYGSGLLINDLGTMQFYSFRDPNIEKTFNSYTQSGNWLKSIVLDQKKLDNFIISCVAKIDAPATNKFIMQYQDKIYFNNLPCNIREINRNYVINTTLKDIKYAGDIISKLSLKGNKCIFGGAELKNFNNKEYKLIDLFAD